MKRKIDVRHKDKERAKKTGHREWVATAISSEHQYIWNSDGDQMSPPKFGELLRR